MKWTSDSCPTPPNAAKSNGVPETIRTSDLRFRKVLGLCFPCRFPLFLVKGSLCLVVSLVQQGSDLLEEAFSVVAFEVYLSGR